MTDLDLVITSNMLRTAVRAKLGSGITQNAIWALIARYARDGAHRRQREINGVPRLPVEIIPLERRTDFLDALNDLPERGLRFRTQGATGRCLEPRAVPSIVAPA